MRRLTRSVVVAVAAGVLAMLPIIPASAHPIDYFNWGDNHTLCQNCSVDQGGVVLFWQNILHVDNHLGAGSNLDGYFGPNTDNATRAWQRDYAPGVDGIVGPNTWNAADTFVADISRHNGHRHATYVGLRHDMPLILKNDVQLCFWGDDNFRDHSRTYHPRINATCRA